MLNDWHPYLIHFPIALITMAFLFQAVRVLKPLVMPRTVSLWLLIWAEVLSFWAGQTGEKAAATLASPLPATIMDLLNRHELMANLTIWGSLLLVIAWSYLQLKGINQRLIDILALAGLGTLTIMVAVTAHWGGQLVYHYSVGTMLFR
jgi:uncharacterized membrane protein